MIRRGSVSVVMIHKSRHSFKKSVMDSTAVLYFNPTFPLVLKLFTGPRSSEKTWYEARDYCRAIGGELLSIHGIPELHVGRLVIYYLYVRSLQITNTSIQLHKR